MIDQKLIPSQLRLKFPEAAQWLFSTKLEGNPESVAIATKIIVKHLEYVAISLKNGVSLKKEAYWWIINQDELYYMTSSLKHTEREKQLLEQSRENFREKSKRVRHYNREGVYGL